ncbi:nitrilase-related carbon-nitrogen hydrolase [Flavobacterium sp.]|uniref:nitrilase-related carbon-nitrogen hydrolase n=1 Tax=Flavobacterium sp. TaxID=239 RepID=UPI003750E777
MSLLSKNNYKINLSNLGTLKWVPNLLFKILVFSFISFISWNYFSLCFIVVGYKIFELLENSKKYTFSKYFSQLFIIIISWLIGGLFWMLEIDKGFFALSMHASLYFLPFFIHRLFFKTKNIIYFIPIIILFEYLLNVASSSFPWTTLGNLFSNTPWLVYWYSYTGTLGGSLWILIISYCLFKIHKEKSKLEIIKFSIVLFIPIFCSLLIFLQKKENKKPSFVLRSVVSINPQYVKPSTNNIEIIKNIASNLENIKADIVLIPEQTIRGIDKDKFYGMHIKQILSAIMKKQSVKCIIIGATFYNKGEMPHNGIIYLTQDKIYFKIKRKLVPLTEYLHPVLTPLFKKIFFNIEGIDESKEILKDQKSLPVVCYEAFFPIYISKSINNANIIFLLSSEHFFNDSFFGKKQYENILRLRTIENNCPLIKCSSFGFSTQIDNFGNVLYNSNKKVNCFKLKINKRESTFYNHFGEFTVLLLIFLMIIIVNLKNHYSKKLLE